MRGDREEVESGVRLSGLWIQDRGEDEYSEECEETRAGGWSAEPEGKVFCQIGMDKCIAKLEEIAEMILINGS